MGQTGSACCRRDAQYSKIVENKATLPINTAPTRMPQEPMPAREARNPKEPSGGGCCGCVLKCCCCFIFCVLIPGVFLGWKFVLCPMFQNIDPNKTMDEVKAPEAGQVVFLGDGNIDYWDGSTTSDLKCDNCGGGGGWAQVESIFPGMKIYNIGVVASTITQWLDEKAVSSMLTKFKPSTVVMQMGQGDIVTGGGCEWIPLKFSGLSAAETNTALEKVLTLLKAGGVTKVYYLSTVYGTFLKEHFKEFEQYDSLAKATISKYASPQFVYIDASTGLPEGSYGSDGIHLKAEAYTKWQAWLQAAATGDQTCHIWSNGVCATSGAATSVAAASQTVSLAATGETPAPAAAAASSIAAPVGAESTTAAAADAVVSPTGGDETAAGTASSQQDNEALFGPTETSAAATPRLI